MNLSNRIENRLKMQGFSCEPGSVETEVAPWLKFTPTLSALWIFTGTILASPMVLWVFSILAAIGAAMSQHPFDLIYNYGLRHISDSKPLPSNPLPRRFSMLIAALWSIVTGILFASGYITAGYISGAIMVTAASLNTFSYFCLGSWIFRYLPCMN